MLVKNLLIFSIISISFTVLNADTFELRPNEISTPVKVQTNKTKELKTGIALDIKASDDSKVNLTVAYEGDYMIANKYLDEEDKIVNNNFYIGLGYKF